MKLKINKLIYFVDEDSFLNGKWENNFQLFLRFFFQFFINGRATNI